MNLKKITLGMGFGDCWGSQKNAVQDNPPSAESATIPNELISTLIRLADEQKKMIEQQQSDIAEIKLMLKEMRLKADSLLHIDAYLVTS